MYYLNAIHSMYISLVHYWLLERLFDYTRDIFSDTINFHCHIQGNETKIPYVTEVCLEDVTTRK